MNEPQPATFVERIIYARCPLCESAHIAPLRTGDCSRHALYDPALNATLRWMQCADCRHVFTEGYFTDEACALVFRKTNPVQKLGVGFEQNRFISARMIEKVLPYKSSGVWLDVGFGNGSLLFTAQEYGFQPVGLDLRAENVKLLRTFGFEAHCANLTEVTLAQQCAVISMADVLEHMPYPRQALTAARGLLEEGGVLLISMPNLECAAWKLLDMQNANPYWGEIEHYHNFSSKRLHALLEEHGYRPLRYGVSERYRVCMEVIAMKRSVSTR